MSSHTPICPQLATFCCFFTIRSGANFVGWFNFVFNALYIGSCVKSLASVRDAMDVYAQRLDADYIKYTYPAFHQLKYDADTCTKDKQLFNELTTQVFSNRDEWREFLLKHEKILRNCNIAAKNHTFAETLNYIETGLMPQLYWSVSIPFLVLVIAIGWLTVVESTSSFRMLKAFAYMFVSAIVIQIIAQTYFISFFHGKLKWLIQKRLVDHDQDIIASGNGIHWTVWFVFIIYSVFNCYAIPVIVTHVNNFEKTVLEDKRILTYEAKPNADASELSRGGARNRSFRIEDDPMGDNFRQSLEDIRVGYRDAAPRTPALSRVTSLTDEPIREDTEGEERAIATDGTTYS